jgi:predicted O-methyltransferase YrrM
VRSDIERIERACTGWDSSAHKKSLDDLRGAAQRLLPVLPQIPLLPWRLRRRLAMLEPAICCLARQPEFFPEMFHGIAVSDDGESQARDREEALHLNGHGLLSGEDIHALRKIGARLSRGNPAPLRIAEIGSAGGGGSTRIVGGRIKRHGGTLYSVDPWPGLMYRVFLANLQIFDLEDVVVPLRSLSVEAAAQFEDGSLDGVFLDGSHIYEDVLADIDAYRPKIRRGGILFGHDLYDLPSRFDREELLGIAAVNNALASHRNRRGEIEHVDVHPGVVLAVQDRFGDDIEHFSGSAVWAKQL